MRQSTARHDKGRSDLILIVGEGSRSNKGSRRQAAYGGALLEVALQDDGLAPRHRQHRLLVDVGAVVEQSRLDRQRQVLLFRRGRRQRWERRRRGSARVSRWWEGGEAEQCEGRSRLRSMRRRVRAEHAAKRGSRACGKASSGRVRARGEARLQSMRRGNAKRSAAQRTLSASGSGSTEKKVICLVELVPVILPSLYGQTRRKCHQLWTACGRKATAPRLDLRSWRSSSQDSQPL